MSRISSGEVVPSIISRWVGFQQKLMFIASVSLYEYVKIEYWNIHFTTKPYSAGIGRTGMVVVVVVVVVCVCVLCMDMCMAWHGCVCVYRYMSF